jgi:hypothetical protein
MFCDYPNSVKREMKECKICERMKGIESLKTWHVNGKCIPCSKRRDKREKVAFT